MGQCSVNEHIAINRKQFLIKFMKYRCFMMEIRSLNASGDWKSIINMHRKSNICSSADHLIRGRAIWEMEFYHRTNHKIRPEYPSAMMKYLKSKIMFCFGNFLELYSHISRFLCSKSQFKENFDKNYWDNIE